MVPRATAIQAAIHFAFGQSAAQVPSGVQTRAYFGLYSDTIYSNRPVWIVRFWGPGLNGFRVDSEVQKVEDWTGS